MAQMQLQVAASEVVAALVLLLLGMAYASDPDPLTDFAPGVTSFTLRDLLKNGDVSVDSGGTRSSTSIDNFPALRSQGLTMVRFKMVPCGSNLPHTHPRATEVLTLISGGPLQSGFVDTSGKAHIDILHPGDVTVFPRGMLHFELNVGIQEAQYISVLNSQNPGTLIQSELLLKLPARAKATAFNVTLQQVQSLTETIYKYGPGLKKDPNSGCIPGHDITTTF